MDHTTVDLRQFVGRSYAKVNCWQLVREFYWLVFKIELKPYVGFTPEDKDITNGLIKSSIGAFDRVEKPEFGDLILVKILGVESHIAIYVGQDRMLHSSRTTGSVLEPVKRWETRISGYYRHRVVS